MLTFKGFKHKPKKINLKPMQILVVLVILLGMIGLAALFQSFSTSYDKTKDFEGLTDVIKNNSDNLRDKTEEESEYQTTISSFTLTDEEKQKLLDMGYTEDQLSEMSDSDFILTLYGKEDWVQNTYMIRYQSIYKNTDEPSDTKRQEILQSMLSSYQQRNYSNVVSQFQNYLKQYTFENYKDEPITSLYYDASQRIDTALLSVGEESDGLSEKERIERSLDDRRSALGVLYDTFSLDINLTQPLFTSTSSDIPVFDIQSISESEVFDPSATTDYSHSSDVRGAADLIYYYKIIDSQGNTIEVLITDTQGIKAVVGVWYLDE